VRAKLARAMENALKHERAEQVSAVDPLTALSNGRGLFLRLDAELARCRRNHAGLAVVVCHVAGLKQVQQRFGPLACAPLHQSIASGLRGICREDDCIARLEDEFVLVLGGFQASDLEEKRKLIESLLDQIGDADLGARVLAPRLGAAFFPEDGSYAEDLLATAGSRLNQARCRVGQSSWPVVPIC
jgi:diguanylate cyclase (GGDEF)-like protein